MSFSDRHGIAKSHPSRDRYEDAPGPVRALLFSQINEADSMLHYYHRLCDLVGMVPDSEIWSAGAARNEVMRIVERMEAEDVVSPANHVGKREVLIQSPADL